MEERYPYQVNTVMPIIGLSIGTIKVPCTQELTKEDVLICLKKAPVFRRFTNGIKERVGIDNIDRLHRENYMTKEEFEKISSNSVPEEVVKAEDQLEEVEPEPEVVPNVVEEEPVVEETVEEEEVFVPVPEVTPEENTIVEEENSIDDDDDVVANELFETIESEEVESEDNFNNQNNNHRKNNRKKKHYN